MVQIVPYLVTPRIGQAFLKTSMLSKRCIGKVKPKEKPIIEPIVWNDANGVQIESDRWWALYDVYLQSPTWAEKRRRVFERARGLCEGCGVHRPSHIHHRRYPRGVLPGSQEWIRAENFSIWSLSATVVMPICIRAKMEWLGIVRNLIKSTSPVFLPFPPRGGLLAHPHATTPA